MIDPVRRRLICATHDEPEVAEQPETGPIAVIAAGELQPLANAPAASAP